MPIDRHESIKYSTLVIPVKDLASDLVAQMAGLYLGYFDGSSEAIFREDLAKKDEVILLFSDQKLAGFTALHRFLSTHEGRVVHVVYSGDTIVDRPHWGQQQLARAWIARIGQIKAEAPDTPLFWLLLVKGHRTYKYLSVFGRSFYPHWSDARPDLQILATRLAKERFGDTYDAPSGIVAFPESRGHLKPQISEPTPEEMTKPATRFFLLANPGFRIGHELVCVCELERSNMKPLAARIFSEALRASHTK
jgi:hypothetical protein